MSLPKHVMRRASNSEYITQRESCLLYCKGSCSAPLQQTRHGLADHFSGIDWHYWPTERPWQKGNYIRPSFADSAYNEYAWKHCKDLIDKYKPCMLWGDIDWPKA